MNRSTMAASLLAGGLVFTAGCSSKPAAQSAAPMAAPTPTIVRAEPAPDRRQADAAPPSPTTRSRRAWTRSTSVAISRTPSSTSTRRRSGRTSAISSPPTERG